MFNTSTSLFSNQGGLGGGLGAGIGGGLGGGGGGLGGGSNVFSSQAGGTGVLSGVFTTEVDHLPIVIL
jgi:hypothetical protein